MYMYEYVHMMDGISMFLVIFLMGPLHPSLPSLEPDFNIKIIT